MSHDHHHSYGPVKAANAGKGNPHDPIRIRTPEWMEQAACLGFDPDWWHGAQNGPHINGWSKLTGDEAHDNKVKAWRICAGCPVRQQCNAMGKATNSVGCWGGEWL